MKIIKTISEWQALRQTLASQTIGFIPTMGAFHLGHISLFERSVQENELSVVSIFVNPTQFDDHRDFEAYPQTLQADTAILRDAEIDYLFLPDKDSLYPDGYTYRVEENKLSQILEGAYRTGHFTGMLTIVLKLLLLVRATHAYFGEKDYQQLQLIRGLVNAFFLPTDIIAGDTVRDAEGLAYSSRNQLLKDEGDKRLAYLFASLLKEDMNCADIKACLLDHGVEVDYICDYDGQRHGAVRIGDVRLIDHVALK